MFSMCCSIASFEDYVQICDIFNFGKLRKV